MMPNPQPDIKTIDDFTNWYTIPKVELQLVLATCLGNPPAVRMWTTNTGRFGSRPAQKPEHLLFAGQTHNRTH